MLSASREQNAYLLRGMTAFDAFDVFDLLDVFNEFNEFDVVW